MQHPFGGSWGYHVTSYFAPDARFGDPDGFRLLVDRLHQAGVGVILDWVPGHFATDEWALARFDGTPLYEDPNPQRGWHKEWGSHIFNFGRREVRNFLYANALYWLEEFHADGLRVDGVASMLYLDYAREEGEWTPNIHGGRENLEAVQFLQEMNATVYKRVPGITTIAEESTSWPGVTKPTSADGLGFGFKWNMGWMHDSLDYVAHEPVHRAYHHGEMTFSLVYAWTENFVLPISHDEVVHGKGSLLRKMPGDRWQQLANLRAYLGFMWAHPGKQLLFMGVELGQESEWAESRELDWWLLDHPEHRGVSDAGARPQHGVRRLRRAVGARPRAGRLRVDRRQRRGPQRLLVRTSWRGRRPGPGLHRELRGGAARRLPARAAVVGRVGRGRQHRRRGLLRLGRRQLRRDHRRRRRLVRPAGVRHDRGPAARDGLVPEAGVTRVARVPVVTAPETSVTTVAEGVARINWTPDMPIDVLRHHVVTALVDHARVEALVDPHDEGAQRAATWSGLRREGVMRGVTVDGEPVDRIVYARLATDVPLHEPEGFRALLNSFLPRKRAISQMLVRDGDGRVLLCQLTYKQDWDLPGGVVEVSESPQLAVSREVEEELGLTVPAGRLLLTDWLPPWSGWDDALCLVFDGGSTTPRSPTGSSSRTARSGPRSSARSSRSASAAPTSPPAGSSPRWRTSRPGPAYTESGR